MADSQLTALRLLNSALLGNNLETCLADLRAYSETESHPLLVKQKESEFTRKLPKKTGQVIYIYAHNTSRLSSNTGIQRITRKLGVALALYSDCQVAYVGLSDNLESIELLSVEALVNIERFNGPPLFLLEACVDIKSGSWLLIPELIYPSTSSLIDPCELFRLAKKQGLKTAPIFHDNIPLVVRQYQQSSDAHMNYLSSLRFADKILCISEWVAQDLLEYYEYVKGGAAELACRVNVVRWPSQPSMLWSQCSPQDTIDILRKYCLDSNLFILCVGSLVPHKNPGALWAAFRMIKARTGVPEFNNIKLVFAGTTNSSMDLFISVVKSCDDVVFVDSPSDRDIAILYESCLFAVLPSVEEGFGLTLCEAIAYNKKVIAYSHGATAEIAMYINSPLIRLVNVVNIAELAEALLELSGECLSLDTDNMDLRYSSLSDWQSYVKKLILVLKSKPGMPEEAADGGMILRKIRPFRDFVARNVNLNLNGC